MTNQVMAIGVMPMILKVKILQSLKIQNLILFRTKMTLKKNLKS